jgi:hypothetical protein
MKRLFGHLRGAHAHGCLSLYAAAGPGFDPAYYRALLKDVDKTLAADLAGERRSRLEVEVNRVRDFLADTRPPGLPLAIFSCAEDGILDARRLPEDVETQGWFDIRFHLGPLEAQLERHPPGIVVVAEKDAARLYAVVLEDVRELDEVEGRKISDTRKQGPDSSHHHVDNEARLNLKQVVDRLMQTNLRDHGLRALYVAGPTEARSRLVAELPQPLRKAVRAELEVQVGLGPDELAEQLRQQT